MPKKPVAIVEEEEDDVLNSDEEDEDEVGEEDETEVEEEEENEESSIQQVGEDEEEDDEEDDDEDTDGKLKGGEFSVIDDIDCTEDGKKDPRFNTSMLIEKENRLTKPFLSKYEKTRIIATRAQQIAYGAMPMIDFNINDGIDPVFIAEEELKQRKTPFIVRRYLPSGQYEDWKMSEIEDIHLD